MKLKFDANQDFQLQAIEAAAGLFVGQPRTQADLQFVLGASFFAASANRLDLSAPELLANLQAVQAAQGITPDATLQTIAQEIETASGTKTARFYNYSVEMETGTGKTYVYIRTALELHRRYGFSKYIVVVPSVAIREGVYKTLQITEAHLRELYGNPAYRYYVYDSANLSQVRQFALSDGIEIMVMTLASFNKAANIIRQSTDRLQGETPIHLVQAARPILILDEPQNMESELSIASLALLDPLLALRYSATHRTPYNIIYRLTPFEAYRQGLVKRIEVASAVRADATAQPYLRLEHVATAKKTLTARLIAHALTRSGTVQEQTFTLRPGDSLQEKTHRLEYAGFEVDEINIATRSVRFANNLTLAEGGELGADHEALFEEQIRYTVQEHLRRQAYLKPFGLKVLSLFFIDRVANYRAEDGTPGLIRRLFDQAFEAAKTACPDWHELRAEDVQAAYFASHRTRSGAVILEDSRSGETDKDREAFDLIMKDKERLLSLEEPVAFIFSHSALREGWDNPNVFQICTLNQSVSEVKKRQEVGRGVRLAVNQQGERVHEAAFNVLTVIANESYERFVEQLQSEIAFEYREEIERRYGKPIGDLSDAERRQIEAEYGAGILPPKPVDARKRATARLRKAYLLSPEFEELWDRIKHKTRYAVKIDSPKLIADVVAALDQETIRPPRITITRARVEVGDEGVFEALQMSAAKTVASLAGRYPLPNLVEVMSNLLEYTTPPVRLTRRTLLEIIRRCAPATQQAMLDNPNEFATVAVRLLKSFLAQQLVDGIQYTKINAWYEMTQFETEIETWLAHVVPAERSLYDHVITDSNIERDFAQALDKLDFVKLFIKLPHWFTVPTPLGEYRPDWAIVLEHTDAHGQPTARPLLYLVVETKGTTDQAELSPTQSRKIDCGKKHFREALSVPYELCQTTGDLLKLLEDSSTTPES